MPSLPSPQPDGIGPDKRSDDRFDFKEAGLTDVFTQQYLNQYYHRNRPINPDECAVGDFIREVVAPHLTGSETCLEIGCGPTVHHAMMLAPYVGAIDMADYLDRNLSAVRAWLGNTPTAFDWSHYAAHLVTATAAQPTEDAIAALEAQTRGKVRELMNCNILADFPLEDQNRRYDVVAVFYCAEEVATTVAGWHRAMESIARCIKPGGQLIMSCLYDSDFYLIVDDSGKETRLPAAKIDADQMRRTLAELGFEVGPDGIRIVLTPSQAHEGLPGTLLVHARKPASTPH